MISKWMIRLLKKRDKSSSKECKWKKKDATAIPSDYIKEPVTRVTGS
jgi:hypothetical protein